MLPARVHLWKLGDGGSRSLALSCTGDGLFLGGTPLIERRGVRYELRPRVELERLFVRAGRAESEIDRLLPGFRVVAAALDERDLSLAQIAAVQLRVSDLPDEIARRSLAAEDRLIKAERDEMLARAGWDPSEHPRAGVPPNPGWFAPTGGSSAAGAVVVAQGEEDERAPEELLDPPAPLRQAQVGRRDREAACDRPAKPESELYREPRHGTQPSGARPPRRGA